MRNCELRRRAHKSRHRIAKCNVSCKSAYEARRTLRSPPWRSTDTASLLAQAHPGRNSLGMRAIIPLDCTLARHESNDAVLRIAAGRQTHETQRKKFLSYFLQLR